MDDKYSYGEGFENILESTLDKQCAVADVVQKRMNLEKELQAKSKNLRVFTEHKRLFDDQKESDAYRIRSMEELNRASQSDLSESRRESEELRALVEAEKRKQLIQLKEYEDKMAVLSKKFQIAPDQYTKRDQLTADVRDLHEQLRNIQTELDDVEGELARAAAEMNEVDPKSPVAAATIVTDGNMPTTLRLISDQLEIECRAGKDAADKATATVGNLGRIAASLEKEVSHLRARPANAD